MYNLKNKWLPLCAVCIVVLLVIAGLYTSRPSDTVTQKTAVEFSMSTQDLLGEFLEDENKANENYVEKVIEVDGIVKEVVFLNNRYTVILHGLGEYACLMCEMNIDEAALLPNLTEGDSITLKGVCKGFLMDAILLNCVIITD